MPNIVLVGIGPHAKRIYIPYLNSLGLKPALLVDIQSNEARTRDYMQDNGLTSLAYFVNDAARNDQTIRTADRAALRALVERLGISHAIIATEPKAHMAYAKLFIELGLNILMDKPISAPLGASHDIRSARRIYTDYLELKHLYQEKRKTCDISFVVQAQRRFHPGYLYIADLLERTVAEFGVPITHIDLYHSDGQCVMPHEVQHRENHPFKYGYGKLLHSGYHFVDLFAWFTAANNLLEDKRPNRIQIHSTSVEPDDHFLQVSHENYRTFFPDNAAFDKFYKRYEPGQFAKFGDIDSYSTIQLLHNDRTITSGAINLLHNGFSRRSWGVQAKDIYKGNGRVRHERINIQLGPLMNIQVHSYQSSEVKGSAADIAREGVGSLDHFDIYIFRNVGIIGGEPVQVLRRHDIAGFHGETDYLGHNEMARKTAITDFVNNQNSHSDLLEHQNTNYLMSLIHQGVVFRREGKSPFIDVPYNATEVGVPSQSGS